MELDNETRLTRPERAPASRDSAKQESGGDGSTYPRALWYWNRLRLMSWREVWYRAGRKLNAKAQQLGVATAEKVAAADLTRPGRPFLALDARVSPQSYLAGADRLLGKRFSVFDREYSYAELPEWNRDPKTGKHAPLSFGKILDYRDERRVGDIKYLWEINRHLDLVTLAQAYRLTDEKQYLEGLRRLLESWLDQCPYLLGPNWASSLELGIRLINWSAVWQLVGGTDSALFQRSGGIAFRDRWLSAIYQHMHFIQGHFSRFSSANNHLIGEAAGLYVGTLTWPFWPATARWRAKARRELIQEARCQNTPDGVNREQAVAYQQFVLDFLLLAGLAGRANADDFPVEYWQRIERMLEFIAALMDVRGNVPMIGDADDGYVTRLSAAPGFCPYRSLLATGAAVFRRGDFKAKAHAFDEKSRWLLGPKGERAFAELAERDGAATLRRAFPDGGYYILGSDWETPQEVRIVADAGPLGFQSIAAHGHADALSIWLSIAGCEFLVDPGTYAYHTERWWRDYFRGTAAHNTVRVDGGNQSVIGGSFMWLRHARTRVTSWQSEAGRDRLVAAHDGYARLPDPVQHERELIYDKRARSLRVRDRLACAGKHRVEWFWHFAEDVKVTVGDAGKVVAERNGHRLRLLPQSPVRLHVNVHRGEISRPAGWVSRRFGVKAAATTIVWQVEIEGTTELDTVVECTVAVQQPENG